jgi:BirA family biotin operon repressor/biotin-[acetyl-CoA-carboxylase] ligase
MSRGTFVDVRRFSTLDSTNTALMDLALRGEPEGVVVVADYQRAGRGRLGRRWEAPPQACLLVSVLLRPVVPADQLYGCTAAVALAARAACEAEAGVEASVKWPNDLLVGDAKVAGILAEANPVAPGGPPGSVAVVVGLGVNVSWAGPPEAHGTSLVAECGHPVDRFSLLEHLLDELSERAAGLAQPEGRRALMAELSRRCSTLGLMVRVEEAGRTLIGRARELRDDGQLVVVTETGVEHRVAAADVVHLRSA